MNKRFKKIALIFSILSVMISGLFFTSNVLMAQGNVDVWGGGGDQVTQDNLQTDIGLGNEDPRVIVARVIRYLLGFLGIIAIGLIMYAGWLYMTSDGNEEKIDQAKKILTGASIGLVIILASFGIASFILKSLLGATDSNPGGGGSIVIIPGGGSGSSFYIKGTSPKDGDIGVPRNSYVKVFFNKEISSSLSDLSPFIKVSPVASVNPDTGEDVAYSGSAGEVSGEILLSSNSRELIFKSSMDCNDEKGTENCFDSWTKYRVVVSQSISSFDGQTLVNFGDFYFSTGDGIDANPPRAKIYSRQVCAGVSNVVTAWGKDDFAVAGLEFLYQKEGGAEISSFTEPGNMTKNQSAEHVYDIFDIKAGDIYKFRVEVSDMAGLVASDQFTADIKPQHCCNGIKDENELDVDCGGDCGACLGQACASDILSPTGTCDDTVCASGVCSPEGSNLQKCADAGYASGTDSCCLCTEKPRIDWISPVDFNGIPNGAPGNFITIGGSGFNKIDDADIIYSENFDAYSDGQLPVGWGKTKQRASDIKISSAQSKSGENSLLLYQVPNSPFGGVCGQEVCQKFAVNCTWLQETKQCKFPSGDTCHVGQSNSIYNEGEKLCSPYDVRANWAITYFPVAGIKLEANKDYILKFNYKGNNDANILLNFSYAGSWYNQCIVKDSARTDANGNCTFGGDCVNKPGYCCLNNPVQKDCYIKNDLPAITSGSYGDWKTYWVRFSLPEELFNQLDVDGKPHLEFAINLYYANAGPEGVNFYIDDLNIMNMTNGSVVFLGEDDGGVDDMIGILPSEMNNKCSDNWTDSQVIVAVPEGAKSGPVKINTKNGLSDRTDDGYGVFIDNFEINNIKRPGLCSLIPNTGETGGGLNFYGTNVYGTFPYFGNINNNLIATRYYSRYDGTFGYASVPGIYAGKTSFFVKDNITGEYSNYLNFYKTDNLITGPYINSFNPKKGNVGQYVTIAGGGFGQKRGDSKVYFVNKNSNVKTEAVYDFPLICSDSVWSNNQILVKVPADVLLDNDYGIEINVAGQSKKATSVEKFSISSTEKLSPSLCRIDPVTGQHNDEITLWGEYFGSDKGEIRFSVNNNQSGAAISYWDKDGDVYKAVTTIHQEAVTGPIKIVSDGIEGNGLNLSIGSCLADSDCGDVGVCCPENSLKTGRCAVGDNGNAPTINDCYANIPNSVYEWDFSTGLAGVNEPCYDQVSGASCNDASFPRCQPGLICDSNQGCTCQVDSAVSETCSGFGSDYCSESLCPNSPGQCQSNTGMVVGFCGDNYCNDTYAACSGDCRYDSSSNKCILNNSKCDIKNNTLINGYEATCKAVRGENIWQIDTDGQSCPDGSFMDINKACSVGTLNNPQVCDVCAQGFSCQAGECVINKKICSPGSSCVSDQCILDDPFCECCCRVDQVEKDCCLGLTCEPGICGAGSDDYGLCSGCTVKTGGVVDEAASNLACNCDGVSLKYCDTAASGGVGVCRDQQKCLLGQTKCGDTCCSSATGCEDASLSKCNNCKPGQNSCDIGGCCSIDCKYDSSDVDGDGNTSETLCALDMPCSVGVSDICGDYGLVCSPETSTCQVSCDGNNQTPVCEANNNICSALGNKSICSPDTCLCVPDTSGGLPGEACKVEQGGALVCQGNDFCADGYGCLSNNDDCRCCCVPGTKNADGLDCIADKTPCGGGDRGLYCGCSSDSQCSDLSSVGCGVDTCCHGRPEVTSVSPADDAENVCRNTAIKAEFSEIMNISSLKNNVYLIGDYGFNYCPDGTEFIAVDASKKFTLSNNIKNRSLAIFRSVVNLFRKNEALADNTPDPLHNFCSIPGKVSGYNLANGKTIVNFTPEVLLDGNRKYYVVIKGEDVAGQKTGVLNYYDIGMNGDSNTTFDTTTFVNAKIWSFETMPEQSKDNGLCKISSVGVYPSSYLFNTSVNDNNENDSFSGSQDFDTANDRDKVFMAQAFSANGQTIAPIPGVYDWSWSWNLSNQNILEIVSPPDIDLQGTDSRQLVKIKPGITDGKSSIIAQALVSDGNVFSDESEAYVFICNNPWPAVDGNGIWSPWRDEANNCGSDCANFNHELYYCRDAGDLGTADDLPALMSDKAVIIGSSSRSLKEFYFLYEDVPAALNGLVAEDMRNGGEIKVSGWVGAANVAGYKLYYGTQSGKYNNSVNVSILEKEKIITGLNDGQKYYFSITAYYDSGAESEYSMEASATPTDTAAPDEPKNLRAEFRPGEVDLIWDPSVGATSYSVYYGIKPGIYSKRVDVGSNTITTIRGLKLATFYYVTITAVDAYGNESDKIKNEIIVLMTEDGGKAFKKTLSVVDFENDSVGSAPDGWLVGSQSQASVLVSDKESFSGSKSLLAHRDANIDFPGTCTQEICSNLSVCTWLDSTKQCKFSRTDNCHIGTSNPIYNLGEKLCSPNDNRTMWFYFQYDVSNLDWQPGKEYLFMFYYKGRLDTKTYSVMSYTIGHGTQCAPKSGIYIDANGKCLIDAQTGVDSTCVNNPGYCCYQAPVQKDCYPTLTFPEILAGDYNNGSYNGWNFYEGSIVYDAGLNSVRDRLGNLVHRIGVSMGYNNTGLGTDFYVDNIIIAEPIN